MKRFIKITMCFVLCVCFLTVTAFGRELVAVGQLVGLELRDGTVTVVSFDRQLGAAAREAGLQIGDRLVSVNGRTIRSAEDVMLALNQSKGEVTLRLQRGDQEITCRFAPNITPEGPKLGLYLRQGISGVGTVTWYDPESGTFGALGHGVNDPAGQLLEMREGNVYAAKVTAIRKGKVGEPGQLMGSADVQAGIGTLERNTALGVFGTTPTGWQGRTMETADWEDVRTGEVTILSTVSGDTVREYSAEILKIYPQSRQTGRNLLIRVTDPELLEITGGIVQGMSGSPIIQDGKLVGAVTHVLVNDPTTGYGIFIENMLDAAS